MLILGIVLVAIVVICFIVALVNSIWGRDFRDAFIIFLSIFCIVVGEALIVFSFFNFGIKGKITGAVLVLLVVARMLYILRDCIKKGEEISPVAVVFSILLSGGTTLIYFGV